MGDTDNQDNSSLVEKRTGMSEIQQKVALLIATQNMSKRDVARVCGVHESYVYNLTREPWMQAAIHIEREKALSEIGGAALATVRELIQDDATPPHIRLKASTWTLEALGHGSRPQLEGKGKDAGSSKPIGEMNLDELQKFIGDAQDAIKNASAIQLDPSESH